MKQKVLEQDKVIIDQIANFDELLSKRQVFKAVTGTKKAVHLTMVTTEGVERNAYWNDGRSVRLRRGIWPPAFAW